MTHHHKSTTHLVTKTLVVDPDDRIQERIRERAYELFEQRGREDGHDFDDWITAELEVKGQKRAEDA